MKRVLALTLLLMALPAYAGYNAVTDKPEDPDDEWACWDGKSGYHMYCSNHLVLLKRFGQSCCRYTNARHAGEAKHSLLR